MQEPTPKQVHILLTLVCIVSNKLVHIYRLTGFLLRIYLEKDRARLAKKTARSVLSPELSLISLTDSTFFDSMDWDLIHSRNGRRTDWLILASESLIPQSLKCSEFLAPVILRVQKDLLLPILRVHYVPHSL